MKIKSKKPSKQRKFLYTAPLHIRRKMMASHLSKELIKQYSRRSLPVRKGDEVQIMRGEFVKKTGKISRVDLKKYKVYVEGITRKRTVGTDVQVPIHPSNLKIINLNLDDERRRKILKRKVKEVEVKHEAKEIRSTKVLESTKESKEMGSVSKIRSS